MSNKQETLFEEQRRTRNVEKYVRAKSKDGSLSIRLEPDVSAMVRRYCKLKQVNCKKLLEKIIREKIRELEKEQFDNMSREDLIEVIQRMRKEGQA